LLPGTYFQENPKYERVFALVMPVLKSKFIHQLKKESIMQTKSLTGLLVVFLLAGIMESCKKSEYTIEDKLVTGTINYVQTSFVPLEMDPVTQQPLKARISFDATGIITDLGELQAVTSFTFDFVLGQGSDFVTTYTGTNSSDIFSASGSSQMTGNMTFTVTEKFSNGKGKFEKISGGGETYVTLNQTGTSGTGDASWTVTY
jgi:hypothetical protein